MIMRYCITSRRTYISSVGLIRLTHLSCTRKYFGCRCGCGRCGIQLCGSSRLIVVNSYITCISSYIVIGYCSICGITSVGVCRKICSIHFKVRICCYRSCGISCIPRLSCSHISCKIASVLILYMLNCQIIKISL